MIDNLPQFAALAALGGLVIYWLITRTRYTRKPSWREARKAETEAKAEGDGSRWASALRWLHVHDGLSFVLRRLIARAQKLTARLTGPISTLETTYATYRLSLVEFITAAKERSDKGPLLSYEVAGRIAVALWIGDIAVVGGVLMAENAELPPLMAAITALAIATAQFAAGKLLALAALRLKGLEDGARYVMFATVAGLGLLGVSLAALLLGGSVAWGFLVLTPALGAAALTLVSHEESHQRFFRARRALRKPQRNFVRAAETLGRALGRAASTYSRAALLAARNITSLEQAVAAANDVTAPGANLTEGLRGTQAMLADLQSIRLTLDHCAKHLNDRTQKLHELADDLEDGYERKYELRLPDAATSEAHAGSNGQRALEELRLW